MSTKLTPEASRDKAPAQMEASPADLRRAVVSRTMRRSTAAGRLTFPAVPALTDHYVHVFGALVAAVGRPWSPEQAEQARRTFGEQLQRAFDASSRSSIVVTYEVSEGEGFHYQVAGNISSIEQDYQRWVDTHEQPFFGSHPDARVTALAASLGPPSEVRILDVGAGTGRNALPLARLGHPVDAIEMTPAFAQQLRDSAAAQGLALRVIEQEFSRAADVLGGGYHLVFLSEVVSDFRDTPQLRALAEMAAKVLVPGGRLLMNLFLSTPGYTPDPAARELSQQFYSTLFTRHELAGALSGTGLEVIDDVSVHDFEQAHLPEGAFPQTSWYREWVRGQDVYDMAAPPVELRWITCHKPAHAGAAEKPTGEGQPP